MKLTIQQIAKIEETLIEKGLIYEDIKLEVTDHIASEIEHQLENNQSNFKEVFEEVFSKWQGELKLTSNWWSSGFVAPKIVIDKYTLQIKKLFKFAVLHDLTFSFLMVTIANIYPQEIVYTVSKIVYVACYSIVSLMLVYCWLVNRKLKSTTIFGKTFRGHFFISIWFLINYTFNSGDHLYRHYFKDSIASQFTQWFMHGFFMFMGVYLILLAFEHFKTVKRYKLV
jgi:hypothetical protein